MATTNGALTPPSLPAAPSSPALAKRKRSDAELASLSNGASVAATSARVTRASRSLQAVLEDILEVLRSYDTQPSILNRPISSAIVRNTTGEAVSKRSKLASPDGTTTISNLVQSGSYDSLSALKHDVETASNDILATIDVDELSRTQPTPQDIRLQISVLGFRERLEELIKRENPERSHGPGQGCTTPSAENATDKDEKAVAIKVEEQDQELASGTVLTIYGSAQGPKQLFSSRQQPHRIPPSHGTKTDLDLSVKLHLPLRESSLPNIISTTQVFPIPDDDRKQEAKSKTFGQVFTAPPNLPQISPPKTAKPLTTRDNTITLVQPDALPKPGRKSSSSSYTKQNLSTGSWLGYGGVDMPKDTTSPTAKQKSRQRALSTGEAQLPPSEATRVAIQQAKEDALFRSAFSSFAPSRDDAAAIVPEETKNKVWWQYVGEKRFTETFPIDPALEEPVEAVVEEDANEADLFKEAVENFVPDEHDPLHDSEDTAVLDKDTEEILKEISELIETLSSYQRIRNSSITTNPRTPVIQNTSLASLAGSPSSPSSDEVDVYQILKSQLSLLISQLPPYAVAKLNGDQLDELNISRTIIITTKNYHGVLEEDQATRIAKSSSVAAATVTPSLARMGSSGTGTHYPSTNSQYARPAQPSFTPSVRPLQTPQSYYPGQAPLQRSPSINYQRSSSGPTQAYPTPGASYGSGNARPSYSATQAYGQHTSRQAYAPATPGYFPQRTASTSTYGGVANPQYNQYTPQPRYSSQSTTNGYYQRPQSVAPVHTYGAAPLHSVSPLKSNPPAAPSTYSTARPSYGTPVSGSQMRTSFYGQAGAPNTSQFGTPQPATPSTAAPSAYGGIGSSHQQMLLDRQNSQVAAQSQARIAAQSSFTRQGSGTPQPPPASQPQVNGSSMVA
ncbi:hypothetical protein BDV96DRAFT_481151 [Lophiotrema nucula]|uniref:Uncharacterized protein n=1 Tax=Lophiotrema nucula TaxID=690887 RepID=A0A6A5ZTY0_9PLEO|nr:hypothetical protein BDV96DRAFT_481151 [Lophiotrema nucula]